jgi:hypothetical protein
MTLNRTDLASAILRLNPDCSAAALAEALSCSEGYAYSLRSFFGTCAGNADAMRQKNSGSSRRCRARRRVSQSKAA